MKEERQLALIDADHEDALFLPVEECRKRYTAGQVEKLEWKREAILMLLSSDWPVETIAKRLKLSTRTVKALAVRHAQKVAGFNKEFAQILMSAGGRWIGLARTKEDKASFKDLMIGAGIAMQHGRELHMMGEVGEEKVVKGDEDRAQAAAALRRMMEGATDAEVVTRDAVLVERPDVGPSDSQSAAQALADKRLASADAGADAVGSPARRLDGGGADGGQDAAQRAAAAAAEGAGDQARAGGGIDRGGRSDFPDGSAQRGLSGKGPDSGGEGSP